MSWVRFPHPALPRALLLGRALELLVGLAVDPLQLFLGELALLVLLLGAGLGVAGVGLVRHRVVARFLLLVRRAGLFGKTEILGLRRCALLGVEVSHGLLLASPLRHYPQLRLTTPWWAPGG